MKLAFLFILLAGAVFASQPENMAVMTGSNTQVIIGQKVFQAAGSQAAPMVGWSQSGASAAVFVQDTAFDAPALLVRRDGNPEDETDTPTMHVMAGKETKHEDPIFQVTGCLVLSGDNCVIVYGDGSLSAGGGITDNRAKTRGKVSISPVYRQLIAEDGVTQRLSWTGGGVTMPVATVSGTLTLESGITISGFNAAHISDSSAAGRAVLTATNAASQRTALGLGTAAVLNVAAAGDAASGEVVKGNDARLSDARTPTAHTHPASQISDSTAAGRAILTATNAEAQRVAIGAKAETIHAELSGTVISFSGDAVFHKAVSTAPTFTFSNVTNGRLVVFELTTTDDVQPTFPPEAIWPGGVMPVQSASSTVVYEFRVINGAIRARATQY